MYLIYFDEVKPRGKQTNYIIGALAIPHELIIQVEQQLNEVAFDTFSKTTLSKDTEFHGTDIINAKKNFTDFKQDSRIDIYTRILNIIDSNPSIFNINITVTNKYTGTALNQAEMAFLFLVEKSNELVKDKGTVGMLIGDLDEQIVDKSVTQLCDYRASGTPFKLRNITNIIDTVHFTKSHHSRMLQLADIYVNSLNVFYREQTRPVGKAIQSYIADEMSNYFPSKYKYWPV